jgi:signal transduction histidine kinase
LSFVAELIGTPSDRDATVARLKKQIHRLADLEAIRTERDPSALMKESLRLDKFASEVAELPPRRRGPRFPDPAPRQRAYRNRTVSGIVEQAIKNIVRNAIRYSPENCAVEVAISAINGSVKISVRNYCLGVPEDMTKVFQPFFERTARTAASRGAWDSG